MSLKLEAINVSHKEYKIRQRQNLRLTLPLNISVLFACILQQVC